MSESPRGFSCRAELPVGKIQEDVLGQLLAVARRECPDLRLAPDFGEDAAVVKIGSRLVAVGADPITFATPRPGFFAVQVNANDLAVTGALPRYFTLTVLLPPGACAEDAVEIVADACEAADAHGMVLIGGHTEVTEAVRSTVVSVTMFGELMRPEPVRTGDGQPGDTVIQVNALGIEGTAILASAHRDELASQIGTALVDRAAGFSTDPGLSVVAPAVFAASRLGVRAMHDPTEGGIATGLRELGTASGTGIEIDPAALLVAPETTAICDLLGYDPLGIISSGCLLLTVPGDRDAASVELLRGAGFDAGRIGVLTETSGEFVMRTGSGPACVLPTFTVDELAGNGR